VASLRFEQLSNSICWQVMEVQSDMKNVAHTGFQSMSILYKGSRCVRMQ